MEDMYGQADSKGSDHEGFETGEVTGYATVQGSKEGYNFGGGVGDGTDWTSGGGGGWSAGGGGGGGGWNVDGGGWTGGGGGGGGWSGGGSGWPGSGSQGWHDNSGKTDQPQYGGVLIGLKY